jgi:hypothetical protein
LVLPILVRPTAWTTIPELAQFQFLNDVRLPLSETHRNEDYAAIAQKIADLIYASCRKSAEKSTLEQEGAPDTNKQRLVDRQSVFLSHSKYDGDFAELMKLRLEKEGISAWIDNDRLEQGVDWRLEIDDSIRNADVLIAIMSPEAKESEYVTLNGLLLGVARSS